METNKFVSITIKALVNASTEKAWECWTEPKHIIKWNAASDDWHTPRATNDLRLGGKFTSRMEAKDGSMGFDFEGVYENVVPNKRLTYAMADGRKVDVTFTPKGNAVEVVETFDAEQSNPIEMQRDGWQAILDNFKKYTES
ncbi:polyketide cyclase [Chryseotalea sanaruensis]|uniref:Polyketide cyclase n=1 Tax=Chryseotalea sanaruensis TaxID=2482724 RepID=A0A401UEU2_9BACT|nr:SRPBCC family protein [Chryseotalea sanaruensis]GCC53413.1 polyketide cyclase [Chryseotalea sanaruensis]